MKKNIKLWEKDHTKTNSFIESFTVGNDKEFDLLLAKHDVKGSLAHTEMLAHIGLLTLDEKNAIHMELHHILSEIENGSFFLDDHVEDIHSQIELLLTQRIGEAGKKIHSGRSRNDQVAVDIKLFLKEEILKLKEDIKGLFDQLITLSEQHKEALLPGYTHLQEAMPSSFGLWFSAYAESLIDDMELLVAAYAITNKNPLGSGAGYGSSLPLNREMTTRILGFKTLHYNVINAQMSRGKTEKFVSIAIAAFAATLAKLSMDLCLFMNTNFGFISLPDELTTGSSIMPHKKNPDIFELIRAKCNRLQALPNELTLLLANLPSGYHRDVQLTKEVLFPGIQTLFSCIEMLHYTLPQLKVNPSILADNKYKYLFTVEAVNQLVNNGTPFREAYKIVGNQVQKNEFSYHNFTIDHHTHEGSMGNLCNNRIKEEMDTVLHKFEK